MYNVSSPEEAFHNCEHCVSAKFASDSTRMKVRVDAWFIDLAALYSSSCPSLLPGSTALQSVFLSAALQPGVRAREDAERTRFAMRDEV